MASTADMETTTKPMAARPRPVSLAHVVLRTTKDSYRKMLWFYKEFLNAEVVMEEENFVFLAYDHEHHRIGILYTPETQAKSGDRAGLEHVSFTFATLTAMARVYQYMKELDVEPYWAVNHGMTSSMYYRDPDGNKFEMQVENFDSADEANAFVAGPLFKQNPIGTDIDPPSWAERILRDMKPCGEEGLALEDMRDIKMRKEIGERHEIPPVALNA
ncbi:hypothetical protein LTS10_000004 [Elasticomyces elasticus]|nr:hypothetical protein LTS10_000004 [Elasticomyces elasticus]